MRLFGRVTAAIAVAAVVVGAALSGCSSEPALPEGWKRVEAGWLSLAVPEGWVESESGTTDYWTKGWQDVAGDAVTMQLLVNPTASVWGYDMERTQFIASAQIGIVPGFSLTTQSKPTTEDSVEMGRVDFTYLASEDDRFEGVFWSASEARVTIVDGRREFKTVALVLQGESLSNETVRLVEESIRVLDTDATIPPETE